MTKSLQIEFALDDLEFLKTNKYLLCFGNRDPGIVWRAFDNYLASNPFTLVPQYEVFGTSALNVGSTITIDIKAISIALGQATMLSENAEFAPPEGEGPKSSVIIHNQYRQPVGLGLSCTLTGPDNVQQTTPFIALMVEAPGEIELTPIYELVVWLQQNVVTGSIIDPHTVANSIEIDLTQSDFKRVLYQGGKWSKPGGAGR